MTPRRLAYLIRLHRGKSIAQIAIQAGISRRQLYRLAKTHTEIADALEYVRDARIARVERVARDQLLYQPDLSHVKTRRTRSRHNKKWHKRMRAAEALIERAYDDDFSLPCPHPLS